MVRHFGVQDGLGSDPKMELGLNPANVCRQVPPCAVVGSPLLPVPGAMAAFGRPRCSLHPLGADEVPSASQPSAQALTAPPMKRCCDSTATTSRLPWGPAWFPGLGSGTPLDVTSGELPSCRVRRPQLSPRLFTALCLLGMPGTAWAR